jgi:hypothetical protein
MASKLATLLLCLMTLSASLAGAEPPAPSVDSELELLFQRTKGLSFNVYGKSLEQGLRELRNPPGARAACLYILAIVNGDTKAFAALAASKGIRVVDTVKKKRRTVANADVEREAAKLDTFGRPSFLGVMNEGAEVAPAKQDWGVTLNKKGKLVIAANGAFAEAVLAKEADGHFAIEQITISTNDD